jgi:hypothetical protein
LCSADGLNVPRRIKANDRYLDDAALHRDQAQLVVGGDQLALDLRPSDVEGVLRDTDFDSRGSDGTPPRGGRCRLRARMTITRNPAWPQAGFSKARRLTALFARGTRAPLFPLRAPVAFRFFQVRPRFPYLRG